MGKAPSLSPCASSAVNSVADEPTAWDIARALFKMHPEYSRGKMDAVIPAIDDTFHGENKPRSQWVREVSELYADEAMVHGRLMILGLCRLDDDLRHAVPADVVDAIQHDVDNYPA